jgi:N-acetylmuramic acid 6-phosphate etherase
MVDVRTTSKKLELRAARIVSRLGGVDPEEAARLLAETGDEVKTSIVMARKGLSKESARRLIKKHRGFLRPILG